MTRLRNKPWVVWFAWLAAAAVPLFIIWLLVVTVFGRITYGFDLEWMEGGLLHHAQRISEQKGIYPPPSVEFVPYLYTPLYPAVLAGAGKVVGISYFVGRLISVLALVGIFAIGYRAFKPATDRFTALCAAAVAFGVFAAGYPMMEGWYDLVRADTLFLCMATLGVHLAGAWGRSGHLRVALLAALLALGFFCKQTGIFYVAWGGVVVFIVALRAPSSRKSATGRFVSRLSRPLVFAAVAGVIGLGGCYLLNQATDGWFWTYIYKIHQTHDFNKDRFWKSFELILWTQKAVSFTVLAAVMVVTATAIRFRKLPAGAKPLLLWAPTFAVSTVLGAVGWGTEFAHYNAFMPAFLHGGLACAAAMVACVACVRCWVDAKADPSACDAPTKKSLFAAAAVVLLIAAPLANSLYRDRWRPQQFTPTAADQAHGEALIARIAATPGEVWVPYHPWYAVLAGKTAYVHKMGIKDVQWRSQRVVAGVYEAVSQQRFAVVIFDNRSVRGEQPELLGFYRPSLLIPRNERPRVFTGANVSVESWWVPMLRAPDRGPGKVVFDFEQLGWRDWVRSGPAWGNGPVTLQMSAFELQYGYAGEMFATSYNSGDGAIGRVTSPPFVLDGSTLQLRLSGGTNIKELRVELIVDGGIVATAGAKDPPANVMQLIEWDVQPWRGKTATLVLVDEATGSWGHLSVDDVRLLP